MKAARHPRRDFTIADHPVRQLRLKVKLEFDAQTRQFVTFVPELGNISTFGPTEEAALNATADMLLGYIDVAEQEGIALPLSKSEVSAIRAAFAGF